MTLDTILVGDALATLRTLPDESVHCCVTSPPYWDLRDYGEPGQLGLEPTPEEYVGKLVEVFREVRRVLRGDGTCWVNLGDSYAGGGGFSPDAPSNRAGSKQTTQRGAKSGGIKPQGIIKPKDLVGIPWRVAFALQADGWYLRSDIIWSKPNPMPESVTDRPTKAHEYVFLFAHPDSGGKYFYDADSIREKDSGLKAGNSFKGRQAGSSDHHPMSGGGGSSEVWKPGGGRNKRTVWKVNTRPYPGAHFAVMPPALVRPCILAGCPVGGVVLDPFAGAGTVPLVAAENGRSYIGIELNAEYAEMARERIRLRGKTPVVDDVDPGQRRLFG